MESTASWVNDSGMPLPSCWLRGGNGERTGDGATAARAVGIMTLAVELPHYQPVSSQEKNRGITDTILLSSGPPILCQRFYIFEPNKNQGVK